MNKRAKILFSLFITALVLALALPITVGAGKLLDGGFVLDPGDGRVWPAVAYANGTHHLFLGHYSDGSDIRYHTASEDSGFVEEGNSPVITRHDVQIAWGLGYIPFALEPHSIVWFCDKWWLYFGAKGIDRHWSIGYATTVDFNEWDISSGPCIVPSLREDNAADPHAVVYNDTVYLYYATTWLTPSAWQLCGSYSRDGENFTKFGDGTSYLVDSYIPGEFLALDNGIIGFISSRSVAGSSYDVVFTPDGESFTWYSGNPVLECGTGTLLGVERIGHIAVCRVGNIYCVYYVSRDVYGDYRLGRTEIPELDRWLARD